MTKAGNSQIMRTITLLITIFSLSLPAYAQYSGGTGEPNDPYQIATADDLILLSETPEDYDKNFILTSNIDLDPNLSGRKVFDRAVIASDANDAEYGFQGTPLTGVLDGSGRTISHLTITGKGYLGLFGRLDFAAEVRNLGIIDANMNGSHTIGALVGINGERYGEEDGGTVSHCYSTGSITGNNSTVGGLVGENWGEVLQSHSTGDVIGYSGVGGLVGINHSNMRQCYSTGIVLGTYSVGGLVGSNWAYLTQAYCTGDVSGSADIGGLVGYNHDKAYVTYCYSSGVVSGESQVGGLVGEDHGVLTQCFSTGKVSGRNQVGGLVGNFWGDATQCYSIGFVSGSEEVGGLVGRDLGFTVHCFWNTQTSGQATSAEGTGKTTAEMQDIQTYLDARWDFVDEITNGTSQIWKVPEEGGYPVLAIFNGYTPPQFQGLGTSENPHLISDAWELGAMVYCNLDAYYQLAAAINLSGIHWGAAVIPRLSGSFDGNNLTISHLTITAGAHLGLFDQVVSGAEVKDLGIVDVNITGLNVYIGGLVGELWGDVNQCYCTGMVNGDEYIGGLVGFNHFGNVVKCYSEGTVNGDWTVGGLVGRNWGDVNESYSGCEVFGNWTVGGLLGSNQGSVVHCYSNGMVISDAEGIFNGSYIGGLVGTNRGPLTDCYFTGTVIGDWSVGGLTGLNTNETKGIITYCHSDGTVSGREAVGGLVGQDGSGILSNCYSTCTVTGSEIVGGLVGVTVRWFDEKWPKVTKCYSTGTVNGNRFVGGLTGRHDYGIISQCHSTSIVSSDGDYVGGLVGINNESIINCYSTGIVNGNEKVGGLVGLNSQSVIGCYSKSNVSGSKDVGGLVGYNSIAYVTRCYSTGTSSANERVGGLIGYNDWRGNVNACFWDIETNGLLNMCGGHDNDSTGCNDSLGKTTMELQTASTFLDAGWDFVDETANGTWWILEGQDYPRLSWEAHD